MRLTQYWKPIAVALVVVAAAIYGVLVVREIVHRTRQGEERRAAAAVRETFVEEEALLGVVWARRHHPRDADECPAYSPSFRTGCLSVIAAEGPSSPPQTSAARPGTAP